MNPSWPIRVGNQLIGREVWASSIESTSKANLPLTKFPGPASPTKVVTGPSEHRQLPAKRYIFVHSCNSSVCSGLRQQNRKITQVLKKKKLVSHESETPQEQLLSSAFAPFWLRSLCPKILRTFSRITVLTATMPIRKRAKSISICWRSIGLTRTIFSSGSAH